MIIQSKQRAQIQSKQRAQMVLLMLDWISFVNTSVIKKVILR